MCREDHSARTILRLTKKRAITLLLLNVENAIEALDENAGGERVRFEQHLQQHEELVLKKKGNPFICASPSSFVQTICVGDHADHLNAQSNGFLILHTALRNHHQQLDSSLLVHLHAVFLYP